MPAKVAVFSNHTFTRVIKTERQKTSPSTVFAIKANKLFKSIEFRAIPGSGVLMSC